MNVKNGQSSGTMEISISGSKSTRNQTTSTKNKSVRELMREARSDYLGREVCTFKKKVKKTVEFVYPETQEKMAVAIAQDMAGKKKLAPAMRTRICNDLYKEIHKMVFKLATQYSITCVEDVDDLAQACMQRMICKLWKFNPKKAKFTTWSWYVCRSVLSKKYRNGQRQRSVLLDAGYLTDAEGESILENMPEKPLEGKDVHERSDMYTMEIIDTIRELIKRHPTQEKFLHAMFGNPDDQDYNIPSPVKVTDAAKIAGIEIARAKNFYSRIVQPFFRQQFVGL